MNAGLPAMDPWWIWCLLLVVGFGACLGSFANVIIFRMPRNIPLGDPKWSFCPHCAARIQLRHNIPILSYFLLGGRCATCRGRISQRYVVVEVLMVLVFLLLFDALFVGSKVGGIISGPQWSVAFRFCSDWTIMSACCILFFCLVALSGIDLEVYWVDIRFTNLAAVGGFVLHALWRPSAGWPQPGPRFGLAALAASAVALITHLLLNWYVKQKTAREALLAGHPLPAVPLADMTPPDPPAGAVHGPEPDAGPEPGRSAAVPTAADPAGPLAEPAGPGDEIRTEPSAARLPAKSSAPSSRQVPWSAALALIVLAVTLTGLVLTLINSRGAVPLTSGREFAWRIGPALAFIFLVLAAGSAVHRESDQEIADCLEAERSSARRVALEELLLALPTVAVFIGVYMLADPLLPAWNWRALSTVQPVMGLGRAASGFLVATALGWGVRIAFTLVLGKEAFGIGDIHLLGAAGAVLGWEVVLVGFFLSSVLALAGKVLTLPFKRSRVMPMGPWLSLGIFIATLVQSGVMSRVIDPVRQVITMLRETSTMHGP